MSIQFPVNQGPAYPSDPPRVVQPAHEVWVNPGWPDEQRVYTGTDPDAAALSYAAAVTRLAGAPGRIEIIWTVDGRPHQHERRGILPP